MNKILIEESVGELFDKISILEIKKKYIKDVEKLKFINEEFDVLKDQLDKNVKFDEKLDKLFQSLKDINAVLKRESRHYGALSGQGLVQTELKNYEKAIKSYQAAQKIYPSIKAAKIMIPQLEELIKGRAI